METPNKMRMKSKRSRAPLRTPRQKRHCAGVPPQRYQYSPGVTSQLNRQPEEHEFSFTQDEHASSSQDFYQNSGTAEQENDEGDHDDTIISAAKGSLCKNKTQNEQNSDISEAIDEVRLQQVEILKRIKAIKKDLKSLHRKIDESQGQGKETIPANHLINGRNIMLMPTRDEYQFSLDLIGMIFRKEELANGLCFVNKRSTKPPLDQTKVERIVGLVVERYPHADMNEIKKRMNQKCRDAWPKPAKIGTQSQQPEGDGDDNQNGANGPDHFHHSHEEDDT
ncbi:uncharacterized protein [Dysidea avara]|uniref:uncharacterized protein isoform X2 n=1 Tax=Dysidea avara TaxID=196820 RepID=UPI00331A8E34